MKEVAADAQRHDRHVVTPGGYEQSLGFTVSKLLLAALKRQRSMS